MLVKFVCIVILVLNLIAVSGNVIDDTELILTFLTHRHGDRTPVEAQMLFSTDPATLEELVAPYGYGQLTQAGLRKGYEVGKFIRQRYNNMLSTNYNFSEIYIRSTDSTRTKKTVLAAMAAVYTPGEQRWNEDINWIPVPYTTESPIYDFNLAIFNCPKYVQAYQSTLFQSDIPELAEYSELFEDFALATGLNLTQAPSLMAVVYDVYSSQISLGLPLGPAVEKLLPGITEVAAKVLNLQWNDERYIHLQAGVFLKEFHDIAARAISGENIARVRIYSAHDFNVYSLKAVSRLPLSIPKYGAILALELRRVLSNGKYVVLPVYKETPEQPEQYLQAEGCDDLLCDFSQFLNITSKYAIDINSWRTECGWSPDLEFDISSIQ